MAVQYANGQIVTSGLVLALDAADRNSLPDEPAINLIGNNPIPVSTSGFSFAGPTSLTMSYNATEQAMEFESDNTAVWGWFVSNNSLNATPLSTSSLYSTSFEWKVGSRNTYTSSLSHQIIKGDGTTGSFASPNFTTNAASQTGSYARVSYTFTPSSAGVNGDRQYRIIGQPFASGSSRIHLFWRKLQLEQNDHSTTFVSGSRNTWVDLSGNNNGTLVNNPIYNSGSKGSIVFNGSTNHVDCGNSSNIQTFSQITLNTWVKFSGLDYVGNTGNLVGFMGKGAPDGAPPTPNNGFFFAYDNRSNNSSFTYTCFGNTAGGYAGGGNNFSNKSYIFANAVWYNITVTVNSSSTGSLFINGVQLGASNTFSGLTISNTVNNLYVGRIEFGGYNFNGNIANSQVYNRALSAAEVLQNYNAQKSRFGL